MKNVRIVCILGFSDQQVAAVIYSQ